MQLDRLPVLVGTASGSSATRSRSEPRSRWTCSRGLARRAAADAGVGARLLEAVDTLGLVAVAGWSPANGPRLLAGRLGARPATEWVTGTGGEISLRLVNAAAERTAAGRSRVALLVGLNPMKTLRRAGAEGAVLRWRGGGDGRPSLLGDERMGHDPVEASHVLDAPVHVYPLIESAFRARHGRGLDAQRARLGALFAPFTREADTWVLGLRHPRARPRHSSGMAPRRTLVWATLLCAAAAASAAPSTGVAAEPPPLLAPTVTSEPTTVERHAVIRLYDWLRPEAERALRVEYAGVDGEPRIAHWQLPPGPGPHPTVLVFPIRAGDHVVSEALAKALVNRGYAAVWLERRRSLFGEDDHREPGDFGAFAADLRDFVLDGRRLIGWLATRPEVDADRIATAGVSLGGILAATTLAVEPRVQAGFFVMAGGGLAEILRDSQDGDLVHFRERGVAAGAFRDGAELVQKARGYTDPVDPLTWANRIDPKRVLLVSARFDRVIAPERTHALWQAMGRPRWLVVPTGHYQLLPYFWWAVGQGADHLDRVFASRAE